jgi:sulfate-transporting ATPase
VLDLAVLGLPLGAMYGLAALGLIVVHRATGNVDLSLGGTAAAGAYVYHHAATGGGAPRAVAVLCGLAVAGLSGGVGAGLARRTGRSPPRWRASRGAGS